MKSRTCAHVAGFLARLVAVCAGTAAVCVAASCARVTVRKVPTPTQYEKWDDTKQAKADAMEGLRFYLPRPFVNVFESFPIGTDIYIAHGMVSADGEYVYIQSVMPLSTRVDVTRPGSAAEAVNFPPVPRGNIFRPSTATGGASSPSGGVQPQSASGGATEDLASQVEDRIKKLEELLAASESRARSADASLKNAEKTLAEVRDAAAGAGKGAKADEPGDGGRGASRDGAETGRSSRTITNSNGAFAYTPLRGNMDIVYLPDFDEQYVVSSQANLGNASFQMNMGQGWSLQGFNSISDNSELNKRIFALIDKAAELASTAADAGIAALFPPAGVAAVASGWIKPQSQQVVELPKGTPVSLKIVVVHYAAKGLYPVIKPRELRASPQSQLFVDLYANRDAAGRVLSFNAEAVDRAIDHYDQLQRRFTVPVYPYQYISFNTFRYVAIEALTPAGSDYGDLYDKTGTAGDPGERQAADLADLIREMLKQNSGPLPVTEAPTKTAQVSEFLNIPLNLGALTKALNDANESSTAPLVIKRIVPEFPGTSPPKLVVDVLTDKPIDTGKTDAVRTALVKQMRTLIASDGRSNVSAIVPEGMTIEMNFKSAGS